MVVMNLIVLKESDRIEGDHYMVRDFRADHIINILKAKMGDTLQVGLLNIAYGTAAVESIENGQVNLQCQFDLSVKPTSSNIDIVCALPRPQTLKKVLHSAAAMSVGHIYFIRSNRVEKSYFHSPMLQEENYSQCLVEGMSQGKNIVMPQVSFHDRFRYFMEDHLSVVNAEQNYRKIAFCPAANQNLLSAGITKEQKLLLALGPEGGWVPFEIDIMQQAGFESVILGPWILRVENALVAAIAQVQLSEFNIL